MGTLVSAIGRRLPEGAIRFGARADALERDRGRWLVRCRGEGGGEPIAADALVIAAPAPVAARLLGPLDRQLGRALAGIEYASSATVTLAYASADLPALGGFGFVVPAVEQRALLACTYASRKYPGRAPEGRDLVRAFVGGALRPDLPGLDDDTLVATVRRELAALADIRAAPLLVRVHRYPESMPQYAVGHLDRVEAIEAAARGLPAVALAGAAYRGVGVPDCVRSGEAAAETVSDRLAAGGGS
jgi:oxygen-dependent protoporphyrinogen oxidase